MTSRRQAVAMIVYLARCGNSSGSITFLKRIFCGIKLREHLILKFLPSGSCHLNYEREFSASASSYDIVHDRDDVYIYTRHAHRYENDFLSVKLQLHLTKRNKIELTCVDSFYVQQALLILFRRY